MYQLRYYLQNHCGDTNIKSFADQLKAINVRGQKSVLTSTEAKL